MLDKLNHLKIGVLGDLMLDKYISGYSERISPEAPVPVVMTNNENICLGGAGNVIANIASLGPAVCPIGIIGTDNNGGFLKMLLSDIGVSTDGIIISDSNCTTTKTRVIANGQQVVRIDNEVIKFNSDTENTLIKNIDNIFDKVDLIIVSDYGKGACSQKAVKYIINKSNELGKPVLIDPRKKVANFDFYRNCTIITPNFYETRSLFPGISNDDNDITRSAEHIRNKYDIGNVIITRGDKGMSVLSKGSSIVHLLTQAKEVFDVSGAGDTVIATLGVCIATGLDLIESANIANIAAGIVISHRGTTPIKIDELKKRLQKKL